LWWVVALTAIAGVGSVVIASKRFLLSAAAAVVDFGGLTKFTQSV